MITSLPEFHFRCRRLILLVQTKEVISTSYGSSTNSVSPIINIRSSLTHLHSFYGDEWGSTWYLWWEIYTSFPAWTHSWNSVPGEEAMSLKISTYETSPNNHEEHPNQLDNNNNLCDEKGFWVWRKVNSKWDNNMVRISQWRGSHCRTNVTVWRKKSKRAGLWESQQGICVGKLPIWVRWFEIEKL